MATAHNSLEDYKCKGCVSISLPSFVLLILRPCFSAVLQAREDKIRNDWVQTMEARLVREELAKCWREEGVNHYQSCHELTQKYIDMIRTHRVSREAGAQTSWRRRMGMQVGQAAWALLTDTYL